MYQLNQGTILITGGAGLIGSNLIWALNQKGLTNILVVDVLTKDEKFKNLVPLKFKDYLDANDLINLIKNKKDNLLKNVKTVFHLGACSATTETDSFFLIKNNYEYTKILCNWAITNKMRFIYASSAATYGNGKNGMNDKNLNLYKFNPLNMYAYSKHLFDLYAQNHNLLNKIIGLKYFNIFGPNEFHKNNMKSIILKSFENIQTYGYTNLFKSNHKNFKDGMQIRDFLYIKDAIKMTLFLAEHPNAKGLFNIGSGCGNTWNYIMKNIFFSMKKKIKIKYINIPKNIRNKYQNYTCATLNKLKSLKYHFEYINIQKAINDYINNYLIIKRYIGENLPL